MPACTVFGLKVSLYVIRLCVEGGRGVSIKEFSESQVCSRLCVRAKQCAKLLLISVAQTLTCGSSSERHVVVLLLSDVFFALSLDSADFPRAPFVNRFHHFGIVL